jgi:hypothetical protein
MFWIEINLADKCFLQWVVHNSQWAAAESKSSQPGGIGILGVTQVIILGYKHCITVSQVLLKTFRTGGDHVLNRRGKTKRHKKLYRR